MNPYWNEDLVKIDAAETIYSVLDTLVSPEDLTTRRPAFRLFRRVVIVECPEFDDFYLKVHVDRYGFPKKTEVFTYD